MKCLFFIAILLSCKSEPKKVLIPQAKIDTFPSVSAKSNTVSNDIHDPYQTGKDTVRLNGAMDKIFKFPEVQAINKRINKASNGKHGVSIMVSDEFHGDTTYYHFRVGDNSHEQMYFNIFDFLLEKKTGQINAYDPLTDSILSLKDWRKTRK